MLPARAGGFGIPRQALSCCTVTSSLIDAPAPPPPAHPSPGLRLWARLAALQLSASLIVFALTGALWGWLRPRYTLVVGADSQVTTLGTGESVEFVAFASYLITVAATAVIFVWVAWWMARRLLGEIIRRFVYVAPALLLACGAAGLVMFSACVSLVSRWAWPLPEVGSLQAGDRFQVVVEVPGLHGFVVVGVVIAMMCWLRLVWVEYGEE